MREKTNNPRKKSQNKKIASEGVETERFYTSDRIYTRYDWLI